MGTLIINPLDMEASDLYSSYTPNFGMDEQRTLLDFQKPFELSSKSSFSSLAHPNSIQRAEKRLCKCGCGQEIIIKKHHKSYGIPKYVVGHNYTGKTYEEIMGVKKANIRKKRLSELWKGEGNCNFGKPFSKEYRRNLSESLKGRKLSEEHRLNIIQSLIGRKHSEETIRKIREQRFGKNNPNWKGGTTPLYKKIWKSQKMKLWRKVIFERDNYICQECYSYSGILHAHHIRTFSKYPLLRFDVDNGITLCHSCHDKIKKREDKLISYFTKKISKNKK